MNFYLRPAIWLISRFTLPRKLALVGMLFVTPLAILAFLLLPRLNADIAFAERELAGIQAIRPISILTAQAQAHRGTIQLALSGNQEAWQRRPDIQARAESAIRKLDDFNQRYGSHFNTSKSWQEVRSQWAVLQEKAANLPAWKSFQLHNEFVHGLNVYLSKLSDSSGMSLDSELTPYYLVRILVDYLPGLIDSIGQAHGMSILARHPHNLSAVERYRLSVAVGEAEESTNGLANQIDKVFADTPGVKTTLLSPLQDTISASQGFIKDMRNEMLLLDSIHTNPQHLYESGTLAIDAAYRLYNHALPVLQELVQARLDQQTRKKHLVYTLTALSLVLVAYLFIGFTASFLASLNTLKDAAQRVSNGDFHAYATLTTRDEMQDIATSFNRMTDSLRSNVSQLRASEDKYRKIMEQAGDMILLADLSGNLVDANRMAETLLGYSREELLRMNVLALTPDAEQERVAAGLSRLAAEGAYEAEHLALSRDSRIIPVHVKCTLIDHAGDKLALGIFRDISAIRETQQRIEFLATHDPLTRLANRTLLYDHIEQALAISQREPKPFALMFIDLDKFKEINDTFGHDHGDQLLVQVATRIQSCVRAADTTARLGGDEFTVLVLDADRETAAATAQRIVDELAQPFVLNGQAINAITASIGISLYPQDGRDRYSLMNHADKAMYRAKAQGNSFRFHTDS